MLQLTIVSQALHAFSAVLCCIYIQMTPSGSKIYTEAQGLAQSKAPQQQTQAAMCSCSC